MESMKHLQGFDYGEDWGTWRENIRKRIYLAHKFGIPDETIKAIAVRVGDFLSEKASPVTKEKKLLQEMWTVATPDERRTIATLMLKMFNHS